MPVTMLENSAGLFGESPATPSIQTMSFQTTAVLQNGSAVQFTAAGVTAGGVTQVQLLGTAATPLILGVAVNAPYPGGYAVNSVATIAVEGVVQALFAGATTVGQYAIQSATAGQLASTGTAPAVGTGVGIVLQAIGGAGLAWIYLCKM